jgi:hypothetical protein
MRGISVPLLALLALPLQLAAQGTSLPPGQTVSFTLPAQAYTTALHFDVPPGVDRFRVELHSVTPGVDVDLFLRHGSAFTERTAYGEAHSIDSLIDQAQYYSIGGDDREFIAVGRSQKFPVRAGRWHLAVLSFATTPVELRLRVDFGSGGPNPVQFEVRFDRPSSTCDVTPWNDPTPVSPVGGNPGTTLGAQRRNAVLEAVRQLAAGLDSEAPIVIRACWRDFETNPNGATTLAAAGPSAVVIEDRSLVFSDGTTFAPAPFLPEKYASYSIAPAARLGGTSGCRILGGNCATASEMTITYNSRIGQSGVANGFPFYLGYDRPPFNALDFVGVSVHELGHGLGFLSFVRLNATGGGALGSRLFERDDIYARQVFDNRGGQLRAFTRLSNEERVAAMTSVTGLSWMDPRVQSHPQFFNIGLPGVLLFAPSTLSPGSTLSHLSQFYLGQLMTPSLDLSEGARQLGMAVPMLYALGWDPEPTPDFEAPAPYAGLWFDRDRNGHGIDFQRVYRDPSGLDIWSLIFYTYDADGRPEWYIAIGPLVDGVFAAALDPAGYSLVRYRYVGGANPQQAVPAESGQVRLDFNQAEHSPACQDGTERSGAGQLAMFRYTLAGTTDSWCLEELVPRSQRPAVDLTGTWYAGANDSGWGSSVATAARPGDARFLFSTLYYPDATGAGRWAFVATDHYQPGQELTVYERRGYCRTCAPAISDTAIGTMRLHLVEATQGSPGANRLGFDVTYGGPQGGRFQRADVPYELLSAPAVR